MRKIGIMGGTFDPVHNGHLLLAQWAQEQAELDEIWFLPAGMPYKKAGRNILSGQERLHMTELAVSEYPCMSCLNLEVLRSGYTYTYETLEQLRLAYPENRYYFILGADCLFTIEHWKKPEAIFRQAVLLAAVRKDISMEAMQEKAGNLQERYGGEIRLITFPRIDISSSEIRDRVLKGESIRELVPEKVRIYIEEKGFYRG